MEASSYFHTLSNLHQRGLVSLFQQQTFLNNLLLTNQQRVAQAYQMISQHLDVEHVQPDGGIFLFAQLHHYLSQQTLEAELQLHQHLLNNLHISILPGQFFGTTIPGWFRLCFARPTTHLNELVKRFEGLQPLT